MRSGSRKASPAPGGRCASFHGPVTTDWKTEKGRFHPTEGLRVNTTVEVWIPAARPDDVTHPGARFLRMDEGRVVFAIGSGEYRFTA
ncbi:alpha-L-rhamnosidase C-terminal domain-containing protein [Streptomyces sp. 35M1]|uniref:alpha-L-rhamnosidase C-terminal domain-containing protein n=1 Tax=Streptomyces sp. 35M1 TaxID=3142978 RepID=UPI003990AF6F